MATTIESIKGNRKWTFYDEPHEFPDSETGWEGLRMTMGDAFEVYAEHDDAFEAECSAETLAEFHAARAALEEAEANWQVAWRAVNADMYALARAMSREEWGTYLRAIERVEAYYRECYYARFGK